MIKIALILILMLIRSMESFSDTIYAVFQKNDRLDIIGKSYFIKTIVALIAFIISDYIFKNILISSFFYFFSVLIVYFIYDKRKLSSFGKLKFEKDISQSIALIKNIKYFVAFNFLIVVISNIPRIIVDYKFSAAELGYFGIIIMIPSFMSLLGQLVIHPMLNTVTNSYNNKDYLKFTNIVRKIFLFITLASIICSLAAYFLGPIVLSILYNISFLGYNNILALTIIIGTFNVFTILISTLLTIMRKTKQQLIIYFLVVVLESVTLWVGSNNDFSSVFILYLMVIIIQFLIFLLYFFVCFKNCKQKN